ncbi:GNAT family N-acetyltransferase [Ornithinimicrobium cavernae]|uniref:GNAT family N-acetyltransferase n=1 Tax=Ornithinimicrobium cavernae TaxID=2666047 RepID=UPI000D699C1A|nr:GNAT family N-acetyltransferase [Ornithinimicrobium cavernae]
MDQTQVGELLVTRVPNDPGPEQSVLTEAIAGVGSRAMTAAYGDASLADSGSTWAVAMAGSPYRRRIALVASTVAEPDRVLGFLSAGLPLTDNVGLAELELGFDPGVDVGRVGQALWTVLRPQLEADGRTTVQPWTAHGQAAQGTPRLRPATGAGELPADAVSTLLTDLGFALEQVERYSVLDVADATGPATGLTEQAAQAAGPAYRPLTWAGVTPPELRDRMAVLRSRMSVDVPLGGLDGEMEVWDAERVRHADERMAEVGRLQVVTAAEHVPSGDLVAYTLLSQRLDLPAVAFQDDTLVHGDHRGHRLGMLVKATNLVALADLAPEVERIHTWNADENAHMLAINVELGFRTVGFEGGWQLRL